VIVNPIEIAVAIHYNEEEMNAPKVTAKGERKLAQKIVEIARYHGVPILRDIPLAHSLNELEVGEEIPEELYEAMAEILRFVYKESQRE
jgi:FlhB-like protein